MLHRLLSLLMPQTFLPQAVTTMSVLAGAPSLDATLGQQVEGLFESARQAERSCDWETSYSLATRAYEVSRQRMTLGSPDADALAQFRRVSEYAFDKNRNGSRRSGDTLDAEAEAMNRLMVEMMEIGRQNGDDRFCLKTLRSVFDRCSFHIDWNSDVEAKEQWGSALEDLYTRVTESTEDPTERAALLNDWAECRRRMGDSAGADVLRVLASRLYESAGDFLNAHESLRRLEGPRPLPELERLFEKAYLQAAWPDPAVFLDGETDHGIDEAKRRTGYTLYYLQFTHALAIAADDPERAARLYVTAAEDLRLGRGNPHSLSERVSASRYVAKLAGEQETAGRLESAARLYELAATSYPWDLPTGQMGTLMAGVAEKYVTYLVKAALCHRESRATGHEMAFRRALKAIEEAANKVPVFTPYSDDEIADAKVRAGGDVPDLEIQRMLTGAKASLLMGFGIMNAGTDATEETVARLRLIAAEIVRQIRQGRHFAELQALLKSIKE